MKKPELELLLDRVSTWPTAAQQDLLDPIIEIEACHGLVYRTSDSERASIERGLSDMRMRRLADEGAVASMFER